MKQRKSKWQWFLVGFEVGLIALFVPLIVALARELRTPAAEPKSPIVNSDTIVTTTEVKPTTVVEPKVEIAATAVEPVEAEAPVVEAVTLISTAAFADVVQAAAPQDEEPQDENTGKLVYCDTNKGLNLRAEPNTDSKILARLTRGEVAEIIATHNGWYEVSYRDQTGFLSASYVKFVNREAPHVKISLSEQIFWLYDGDELLMEVPCISGRADTKYATPSGLYAVDYKQKKCHLRKYNVTVNYWMGINGGIGLHDAWWRPDSDFTPEHYLTDGSHGCINLKKSDAATIYDLLSVGSLVEILD